MQVRMSLTMALRPWYYWSQISSIICPRVKLISTFQDPEPFWSRSTARDHKLRSWKNAFTRLILSSITVATGYGEQSVRSDARMISEADLTNLRWATPRSTKAMLERHLISEPGVVPESQSAVAESDWSRCQWCDYIKTIIATATVIAWRKRDQFWTSIGYRDIVKDDFDAF